MRVVWLDGALLAPERAALSIDDPGVRFGEGLFETMLALDGEVPWLERHIARLERSAGALRLAPMPSAREVRAAVGTVVAALGGGRARIRVTATPRPTLLVEGSPIDSRSEKPALSAYAHRGAWHPLVRLAEHKTLSFLGWRLAQREAEATGADIAFLLDAEGRLGEASTANVFVVLGREVVTAPVRGILPGIARSVVMETASVREEILDEASWRAADEIFVTSGVRGVAPIVSCDGQPVGTGVPGPATLEIAGRVNPARTDG